MAPRNGEKRREWAIGLAPVVLIAFGVAISAGTLIGTISSLQNEYTSHENKIDKLQDADRRQTDAISKAVNERNEKIDKLDHDISVVAGKMEGLEATIDRFERRLELLEHVAK
jgi:peptidoglycan hydrolase CwlO-like protein